jgi:hypothetical protein
MAWRELEWKKQSMRPTLGARRQDRLMHARAHDLYQSKESIV